MPSHSIIGDVKLTSYASYEARGNGMERCPWCHNTRIGRTPRRKAGPAMFHCKKCGYVTNIDLLTHVHWMLGHGAA